TSHVTCAVGWALSKAVPRPCIALCSLIGVWLSCLRHGCVRWNLGRSWSVSRYLNAAFRSNSLPALRSFSMPIPINWSRCSSTCWPMPSIHRSKTALIPCVQAGGLPVAAWVAIEDRGLGIANADNLFVPFYTTKPTGSGVGLALAQQIARAHGGEIQVVNREDGAGARALVSLPTASPAKMRKEVEEDY